MDEGVDAPRALKSRLVIADVRSGAPTLGHFLALGRESCGRLTGHISRRPVSRARARADSAS